MNKYSHYKGMIMEPKKTKLMLKTERRIGKSMEQAIPEAYEKWGTLEAAANALDIPFSTFRWWMKKLGIIVRHRMVTR